MNGLEIDLAELEIFEKQLADKRKTKPNVSANVDQSSNSPDELDQYLDRLAIDIKARDNVTENKNDASAAPMPSTSASSAQHDDTIDSRCSSVANNNTAAVNGIGSMTPSVPLAVPQTSLPLLLYGLMSILVFINSVCYSKRGRTNRLHAQRTHSCSIAIFDFTCRFRCRRGRTR